MTVFRLNSVSKTVGVGATPNCLGELALNRNVPSVTETESNESTADLDFCEFLQLFLM